MVIDKGLVPELAVTAVFPFGLKVRPKGWGAVTILFPVGVINLPLGITVFPDLLILQNSLPAGAEIIQSELSS